MKYAIFLSKAAREDLEFESVSQELRVHLTRLIDHNDHFREHELINKNWLVNRSRTLVGKTIYVLEANAWDGYEDSEYAWHAGEFELCLRRLDVPRLVELLCEVILRRWLDPAQVNEVLEEDGASFRFVGEPNLIRVEVFPLTRLEEDTPQQSEHPNVRLLVSRMNSALEAKDYAAVLHASASTFETLAKHLIGTQAVQDQSLGAFFDLYKQHSKLPQELQAKVLAVYKERNGTPLAGHGSTKTPKLTRADAVALVELTKAFVRIEYALRLNANDD